MKRLQHPQSLLAAPPSLDLFTPLPTGTGLKAGRLREIPPIHPVNSEGPFEWHVQSQFMINMLRSYIYCKFRIFNHAGVPHPATRTTQNNNGDDIQVATTFVAPTQGFAKALFGHATVTVDGMQVEDVHLFHYKSFLEYEFTTSQEEKQQLQRNLCYSIEEAGYELDSEAGHLDRGRWLKDGKVGEIEFRPALALFQQEKLWLRNTEMRLRFDRNPDSMLIDNFDGADSTALFHIHIDDIRLLIHEQAVDDQPLNYIESQLAAGAATAYNIRPVEMRSFHIAKDRQEYEVVLTNTPKVPLRVLIAFVPNESFHGLHKRAIYNFVPGGVRQIDLQLSGQLVGYASSYEVDFRRENYLRLYQAHLDALGLPYGTTNNITYNDFGRHRCLYAWEISPYSEEACLNFIESGILSVKINFASPVTEPLMMIAYLEGTSVLQLTASRKVLTTNTVSNA